MSDLIKPVGSLDFWGSTVYLDDFEFEFEAELVDKSFDHHFGIEHQTDVDVKIECKNDLPQQFKDYLIRCIKDDVKKHAEKQYFS